MKQVVRLFLLLILLLAASAVPSPAILPVCSEFCNCESDCDQGCWDNATLSGMNCSEWGACYKICGNALAP